MYSLDHYLQIINFFLFLQILIRFLLQVEAKEISHLCVPFNLPTGVVSRDVEYQKPLNDFFYVIRLLRAACIAYLSKVGLIGLCIKYINLHFSLNAIYTGNVQIWVLHFGWKTMSMIT